MQPSAKNTTGHFPTSYFPSFHCGLHDVELIIIGSTLNRRCSQRRSLYNPLLHVTQSIEATLSAIERNNEG